jgi:hypothetical protein
MQNHMNHLELHKLEHEQRVREANQERLADEIREQRQPAHNEMLHRAGAVLVELGEFLQEQAQPQPVQRRA